MFWTEKCGVPLDLVILKKNRHDLDQAVICARV